MKRLWAIVIAGILVGGGIAFWLLTTDSPELAEPAFGGDTTTPNTASEFTSNEIATLSSVRRITDHPFYTMHFVGSYRNEIEERGDRMSKVSPYFRPQVGEFDFACSLFAAAQVDGGFLFGRNFDWSYHPILLLFTDPDDGYASVSFVDLTYFVSAALLETLDEVPIESRAGLLGAPYAPFDGMNERGLVVGMAAIPSARMPIDPTKGSRGSVAVIRDMLDYAATVGEAIDILTSVNVIMTGGPDIHYLIADTEGQSAIVEFADGVTHIFRPETAWQHMTNFRLADVQTSDRQEACWRYATLSAALQEADGQLNSEEAMHLLESVKQASTTRPSGTLWSAVYEMDTNTVRVAIRQRFDEIHTFRLP
ncbi:carcinine hydrolase/isopenicillin-N N-acyltransferase family protein [Candidatus Bipolaricaulota bacterium]